MSLMGDVALRHAIRSGAIGVDPAPDDVQAASIDLRLGPEAFLGTGDEVLDLDRKRLLVIPPGELALVSTFEKLHVSPRYAAQIGLRSTFARKGLALLAGPQVDPGFRGRLHVALVNLSPTEIPIAYGEPLVTVVFHDLGTEVERPYGQDAGDEYHEQDRITGGEIDDIRQHRGYPMSEVIQEMAALSANVGTLRTSVDAYNKTSERLTKRTDACLALFVATILALAGVQITQSIRGTGDGTTRPAPTTSGSP